MRITGGEFGGRNLKVPKTDAIRPTQDRVREALFNIIQCEIAGADFLDLFAGSGAVGLEALSRGAKSVTFVEANRKHITILNENLNLLCSPSPSTFASFTMIAKGLSKDCKYVKSVVLNGKPITDWKIRHEDIVKGGELVFEMEERQ